MHKVSARSVLYCTLLYSAYNSVTTQPSLTVITPRDFVAERLSTVSRFVDDREVDTVLTMLADNTEHGIV